MVVCGKVKIYFALTNKMLIFYHHVNVYKGHSMNNENKSIQRNVTHPEKNSTEKQSHLINPPSISLPKGGGAIKGIGEKFAANPVTGTGSMTVPIYISPGRSGFGPQLSLSYDSGSGNGQFGLGWNLSLPSITRKTDKGLPRYHDTEESDVFILSGAEDLVPILDTNGNRFEDCTRAPGITIHRYRPRIEGLFARIERWTDNETGVAHWQSISKENVTTIYGADINSTIFYKDKNNSVPHIFSWLISETYDEKGNWIRYEYKEEDDINVDSASVNEQNRTSEDRNINRYIKRIKYGNTISRLLQRDPQKQQWLFEVVFDYGDHNSIIPITEETSKWACRTDPFSSYRSGFEIRTYRLCQRVLMFHHFEKELGTADYLVKATHFNYTEGPVASFVTQITQLGYQRQADGTYKTKSLPPVEFEYSPIEIDENIKYVDPQSLENVPIGLDGHAYQWVDLDGEGLSGILTDQAGAWYYKRNLSAIPEFNSSRKPIYAAQFGPMERVTKRPATANLIGGQQLLDLNGNGQVDIVDFNGNVPGYYERSRDENWEKFTRFESLPNIDWKDQNLKFIDLTGDGHADILITEDEVFTWYQSLAEKGFSKASHVHQTFDEENGPRLVFNDGTQSIYLSDFSGDGLTDIVRIRNGEVCYWPNLGYGRFGPKVTMANSPWFDYPDQFDQRRLRLADIDGSGVVDIIYLNRSSIDIYFNQSGNSWSSKRSLTSFPKIDNHSSVMITDLFGNGTACLVWSSSLPGDSHASMRYIDLMGGDKPHLLVKTSNNLGTETIIQYAPSTKFYLQDKRDGKPWITRLSFPVHVVEKVTVKEKWRNIEFSSTYSYHHGYFDGNEREFRGFGRVEQVDVETYDTFSKGNEASPFITSDKKLYQPPIKTVTWYHTGVSVDRKKTLSLFTDEYFPNWLEKQKPNLIAALGSFKENDLPEPVLDTNVLTADEWCEALRACKGMVLRQEVYELDVDALHEKNEHVPVRLFSTAYHNANIHMLQSCGKNRHAVFLVTESEAITYNYEMDLRSTTLKPDPRIAHTLNLSFDEYGNIQQSVAVVYPRVGQHEDSTLSTQQLDLIRRIQKTEHHLVYTESHFTNDITETTLFPDDYRLRLPCEVLTFELTGIGPDSFYFKLRELQQLDLSTTYSVIEPKIPVGSILYHEQPDRSKKQMRCVEHIQTCYFKDDLSGPLGLGELGPLGLPYENYKLALTDDLLDAVYGPKLSDVIEVNGTTSFTARDKLKDSRVSGYLKKSDTNDDEYWMRSGIAGFASDAADHFYLPECYTDPFGNRTTLSYDDNYDLYIKSSTDALGNTVSVERFDYRVLAPSCMKDTNDNHTEVCFDILGMVIATAVKGKLINGKWEGDNLDDFDDSLVNPNPDIVESLFTEDVFNKSDAISLLANATTRFVYYFGEKTDKNRVAYWAEHPASACSIVAENHASQQNRDENSPIQVSFEYSDGLGAVLVKKSQAEPETKGSAFRWIASGKTILNNKGKPVKQYEPYFSTTGHRYDEEESHQEIGVTPVMYYDAAGRLIRTEMPDGTLNRIEFSPWYEKNFDTNDTVLDSTWYQDRGAPDPNMPLASGASPETRSAWLAAQHAGTPMITILDCLGRSVITIVHNKYKDVNDDLHDEKYVTYTKLDTEGKPLWIRDARGNLVMQYITPIKPTCAGDEPDQTNVEAMPVTSVPCYDIAGNLLFQHSMDSGDRWMLMDAAGKPMFSWDSNETPLETGTRHVNFLYFTEYDPLHRPIHQWLYINQGIRQLIDLSFYGECISDLNDAKHRNLCGQLYQHYDSSGLTQVDVNDFKANPLVVRRRLTSDYKAEIIDWSGRPDTKLESETFIQITEYDALSRMSKMYNWHKDVPGSRVAVYEPKYNDRGILLSETLDIGVTKTPNGYNASAKGPKDKDAIAEIWYNAKGQKVYQRLGNGTVTRYDYDPQTFRLMQLRSTRVLDELSFPIYHSNLIDDKIVQQLHYTYDPVGNITEIHDEAYEPVFFQGQKVEPRSFYEYDALYRLIKSSGRENNSFDTAPIQKENEIPTVTFPITDQTLRNYTQLYTYDCAGNITQMKHQTKDSPDCWTRNYIYAIDSNRLLHTVTGNEITDYKYDTHGNMLNTSRVAPGNYLQWDYRDMISTIDLEGGGIVYYNYDAGKQRSRKVIVTQSGVKQWERVYLGGMEIYRSYTGGNITEEIETFHLFEGSLRVLLVDDVIKTNSSLGIRTLYKYQYSNHLGSACLEMDDRAEIVSYEEYHPYGTTAYRAVNKDVKTTIKRYQYTGMERDEESGLSYHGARYYASWLGKWVSCDPAGIKDGLNIYTYTTQNPILYKDKKGTQSEPSNANTQQIEIEKLLKEQKNIISKILRDVALNKSFDEINRPALDRKKRVLHDKEGNIIPHYTKNRIIKVEHSNENSIVPFHCTDYVYNLSFKSGFSPPTSSSGKYWLASKSVIEKAKKLEKEGFIKIVSTPVDDPDTPVDESTQNIRPGDILVWGADNGFYGHHMLIMGVSLLNRSTVRTREAGSHVYPNGPSRGRHIFNNNDTPSMVYRLTKYDPERVMELYKTDAKFREAFNVAFQKVVDEYSNYNKTVDEFEGRYGAETPKLPDLSVYKK
jgi:RHS repeat-associated protein